MGSDPLNPRFPLFDSLRAIAALCVLLTHVSYVTPGSFESTAGPFLAQLTVGVPIFFVISGFLLYRPYFSARFHGRERPRAWDFARRRVLRIVPAYWVALTLLALVVGLTGVFTEDWWLYYGFAQVYTERTALSGMTQAWSLCVEVTFYLALPFYALALERLSRGAGQGRMVRAELAALGLAFVACMAFRAYVQASGELVWFLTLPANVDWFVLGMVLAVASVVLAERERQPGLVRLVIAWPAASWLGAAAVFVVVAVVLDLPGGIESQYTALQRLLQHLLFGACAFLLVVPAVFGDDAGGATRRLLALPALAWLGAISYGVFLYNSAIASGLRDIGVDRWVPDGRFAWLALATFAVTVACAAASWYLMERPLLRRKPRGRSPAAPIASGAIGDREPAR